MRTVALLEVMVTLEFTNENGLIAITKIKVSFISKMLSTIVETLNEAVVSPAEKVILVGSEL